jgi:serine/threonine protein kinase
MGEVYRARDTKLGREVAIKVLPEAWARDPERLARIDREARVLASLNHPSIASFLGHEESDGTRFLARELVPGPIASTPPEHGRRPTGSGRGAARGPDAQEGRPRQRRWMVPAALAAVAVQLSSRGR